MEKLRLLKSEAEYKVALQRIRELWESPEGTPEADEEELLVLLVEHYEQQHYPVEELDPIEYLKIRMEVLGLQPKDLVPYLGDKGTVSLILNRKRPLSLANIRALHKGLNLSPEVLIRESAPVA
jgi:HTH-type transcriptional regulator/antitoxin HigA